LGKRTRQNTSDKMSKKKDETKTKIAPSKAAVKDSSKLSTKKSNGQDNVVERSKSEAGKGDKLRRGITQDAWGKKYEKIFGKKDTVAREESG